MDNCAPSFTFYWFLSLHYTNSKSYIQPGTHRQLHPLPISPEHCVQPFTGTWSSRTPGTCGNLPRPSFLISCLNFWLICWSDFCPTRIAILGQLHYWLSQDYFCFCFRSSQPLVEVMLPFSIACSILVDLQS